MFSIWNGGLEREFSAINNNNRKAMMLQDVSKNMELTFPNLKENELFGLLK